MCWESMTQTYAIPQNCKKRWGWIQSKPPLPPMKYSTLTITTAIHSADINLGRTIPYPRETTSNSDRANVWRNTCEKEMIQHNSINLTESCSQSLFSCLIFPTTQVRAQDIERLWWEWWRWILFYSIRYNHITCSTREATTVAGNGQQYGWPVRLIVWYAAYQHVASDRATRKTKRTPWCRGRVESWVEILEVEVEVVEWMSDHTAVLFIL